MAPPPSLQGTLPATGAGYIERGNLLLGALCLLFGWALVSTSRRRGGV